MVVKQEEIWRVASENGGVHLGIGAVDEFVAEGVAAAFQLVAGVAAGTLEIDDRRVSGKLVETIGGASWAIEVFGAPGFAADAGALGGAFVFGEAFGREGEIHSSN